jgi:hypothetical protein
MVNFWRMASLEIFPHIGMAHFIGREIRQSTEQALF